MAVGLQRQGFGCASQRQSFDESGWPMKMQCHQCQGHGTANYGGTIATCGVCNGTGWIGAAAPLSAPVHGSGWMMSATFASGGAGSVTASSTGFHNARPIWMKPDPSVPDTLGWRAWRWSEANGCLQSPSQATLWPEAELVVPHWDEGEAVRGTSGVHALLVPKHWQDLGWPSGDGGVGTDDPLLVTGIVERFGKYVLGTEGWRAEWVVIKELLAPTTAIGLAIEQKYPDVIVHYADEGEASCTSATSSAWGKGSRSTSRPRPHQFSPSQSSLPSQASLPALQAQMNNLLQNQQSASPPTPSQPPPASSQASTGPASSSPPTPSPALARWLASPTPPSGTPRQMIPSDIGLTSFQQDHLKSFERSALGTMAALIFTVLAGLLWGWIIR